MADSTHHHHHHQHTTENSKNSFFSSYIFNIRMLACWRHIFSILLKESPWYEQMFMKVREVAEISHPNWGGSCAVNQREVAYVISPVMYIKMPKKQHFFKKCTTQERFLLLKKNVIWTIHIQTVKFVYDVKQCAADPYSFCLFCYFLLFLNTVQACKERRVKVASRLTHFNKTCLADFPTNSTRINIIYVRGFSGPRVTGS